MLAIPGTSVTQVYRHVVLPFGALPILWRILPGHYVEPAHCLSPLPAVASSQVHGLGVFH